MSRPRAHVPVASGRPSALVLSAVLAGLVSAFPPAAAADEPVTGAQVRAAILRAVDALKQAQTADGTWPDYAQAGGVTALATYALLEAGVSPTDDGLARAIADVRRREHHSTYVVSLKILALATADAKRYAKEIRSAADWLVARQTASGGWGYGPPPAAALAEAKAGPPTATGPTNGALERARTEADLRRQYERPDASNSQFALLALAEADRAGAAVPRSVWAKADRRFRAIQLAGGGWSYLYEDPDPDDAYGSLTAAVTAGLVLCHERLADHEPPETSADRLRAIEGGLGWLAEHYTLDENPNHGLAWYYFWLYSLERLGVIAGRRTLGDHDWFREGTDLLVRGQRADGRWTRRLYNDALCLLFLAKGYEPLLVQRLRWPGPWRRDPRDLNHLVAFLGKRVGGDPVAWRTVDAAAPLKAYLAAPILHVTGRGPLRMPAGAEARLRDYVRQGGLVLVDPAEGDEALAASVGRLLAEAFPEAAFRPLPADHPLARAAHRVDPRALGLEAMPVGCRAGAVLARKPLAERWASADPARAGAALRFGENLARYATGGQALPGRLDEARVLTMPETEPPARGALRVGQIQHDGDWRPRPFALPRLLKHLAKRSGVKVHAVPTPVRLDKADLSGFPVLYLTGHYTFRLSAAERRALRGYLDRGGFLWAHACCGRRAFEAALRGLVAEMFPGTHLERLPADHPLYSGRPGTGPDGGVGEPIRSVVYAEAVRAETPDLSEPVLYGLERGGHLVLVFSPYGLADGLDGLRTYGARTVAPADARRLAGNILLHALAEP